MRTVTLFCITYVKSNIFKLMVYIIIRINQVPQ